MKKGNNFKVGDIVETCNNPSFLLLDGAFVTRKTQCTGIRYTDGVVNDSFMQPISDRMKKTLYNRCIDCSQFTATLMSFNFQNLGGGWCVGSKHVFKILRTKRSKDGTQNRIKKNNRQGDNTP